MVTGNYVDTVGHSKKVIVEHVKKQLHKDDKQRVYLPIYGRQEYPRHKKQAALAAACKNYLVEKSFNESFRLSWYYTLIGFVDAND